MTRSSIAAVIVIDSAWSSVSGVPWLSVTRTVKFSCPTQSAYRRSSRSTSQAQTGRKCSAYTDQLYGVSTACRCNRLASSLRLPSHSAGSTSSPQGSRGHICYNAWSSVSAGDCESVALTVKLLVPEALGVPVIAPLPAVKDNPAGSEPETTDQL